MKGAWNLALEIIREVPVPISSEDDGGFGPTIGDRQNDVGRDDDAASSLASGLKDTARSATAAVQRQAAQFAESVGHELGKTGEDQKARGVEAMRGFARAIESAAAELEGQSPVVAKSVRYAASQVDGLSDNLSSRSVNELMDAATQLARAQPAMFIGGAVAAGFALARFLKSSARRASPGEIAPAMAPPSMNGPINAPPAPRSTDLSQF